MRIALLAAVMLFTALVPALSDDYKIVSEDVLAMSVWGESQLQGIRLVVGPDGNVTAPVVGAIRAEGLTTDELAQKISEAFAEKRWIKNAQVQIVMIEMHKPTVTVTGNVNRPGKFEFKDGDTIMEAIAQAGSYQDSASLAKATLTRNDGTAINVDLYKLYFKGDTTQNIALLNGDTIYVPEDTIRKIYVLGEVQRPGMYPLKEDMTALSAVSIAGGPIPDRGQLKGTMVIRGDPANPEKIKVDISKMIGKGDLSQDLDLRPGDLVYVPKSSKPTLRDIAEVLGVLSSFRYVTQGFGRF